MLKSSGPKKHPCGTPEILEHTVDIVNVYRLFSTLHV